jgi:hypothetical protein
MISLAQYLKNYIDKRKEKVEADRKVALSSIEKALEMTDSRIELVSKLDILKPEECRDNSRVHDFYKNLVGNDIYVKKLIIIEQMLEFLITNENEDYMQKLLVKSKEIVLDKLNGDKEYSRKAIKVIKSSKNPLRLSNKINEYIELEREYCKKVSGGGGFGIGEPPKDPLEKYK